MVPPTAEELAEMTPAAQYYWRNPEKGRANARAWREKNIDKAREHTRIWMAGAAERKRKALGIPPATRPEPSGCEICGKLKAARMRQAALCIDHDHTTGKFRGWICSMCNMGMANLGDDVAGLERVLAYIRRNT